MPDTDLTWLDIKAFFLDRVGPDVSDPGQSSMWIDLQAVTWVFAVRYRDDEGGLTFHLSVCCAGAKISHPCETLEIADRAAAELKDLVVAAQSGKWAMQAQIQEHMIDRLNRG